MWLGHIPWAGRYWALPVLTALAPSERYYRRRGRSHKKLTDWARQIILQLRRWLPTRPLVLVGDSGYAVLDLLHFCQSLREPVTIDHQVAAGCRPLCPGATSPAGSERPSPGERRASACLESAAQPARRALCHRLGGLVRQHDTPGGNHLPNRSLVSHGQTARPHPLDPDSRPQRRIRLSGVALHRPGSGPGADTGMVCVALAAGGHLPGGAGQEVRSHLGVGTQRQWSGGAIARTTPVLTGLFSWISLAARL